MIVLLHHYLMAVQHLGQLELQRIPNLHLTLKVFHHMVGEEGLMFNPVYPSLVKESILLDMALVIVVSDLISQGLQV